TLKGKHHARCEGAVSAGARSRPAHSHPCRAAKGIFLRHERKDAEPNAGLAPQEDTRLLPSQSRRPAAASSWLNTHGARKPRRSKENPTWTISTLSVWLASLPA